MKDNSTLTFRHSSKFPYLTLTINPIAFGVALAFLTTLLFHGTLFNVVQDKSAVEPHMPFLIWTVVFALNTLLFLLCSLPRLQKTLLVSLFLIAASSNYFITHFGTVIDKSMLQNLIETDIREAAGLLNSSMLLTLAGWVIFILIIQLFTEVKFPPLRRYVLHWIAALLITLTFLGGIAASQFSTLAPFFRNHRDVKYYALPISPISSTISVAKQQLAKLKKIEFKNLGKDVVNLTPKAPAKTVVLVLGETARTDHFQLNGYTRTTNPKLSLLPVISFRNVSSCGTATAHSVPCMFSSLGREAYNEEIAYNSSNIIDILSYSGVEVTWYDNNSGCKGVCDRVPSVMLFQEKQCEDDHCTDLELLNRLRRQLEEPATGADRLIVLHQLGSHGPEYYKRSEVAQKKFLPECTNKQLNQCIREEVINAYDNSILATDELLAGIITTLQPIEQSAMFYISDHGESLGENGVYLHGLPYWMAPEAQTQVPLILWLNTSFAAQQNISLDCLKDQRDSKLSHDNLFHSLPALFSRQSAVFKNELNLFEHCQD